MKFMKTAMAAVLAGQVAQAIAQIIPTQAPKSFVRRPGPGVKRAEARLAAKRKANEDIPSAWRYTRQQARAEKRQIDKMQRSARKEFAMKNKRPGGAAEVL